jgi:hypothetical protein
MPRSFLAFAAVLAVFAYSPFDRAHAQNTGLGVDPFSLYYGYYLPHAAAMAAQPSPLDSINQATLRRQQSAQTDRSTLYDPISPYGDAESETLSPYSSNRRPMAGAGMAARVPAYDALGNPSNLNARGHGPSQYFNRYARYHPTVKIGRGPNRNIASVRSGRAGIGGGGMPSMPSMPSMPGPR